MKNNTEINIKITIINKYRKYHYFNQLINNQMVDI